MRLARAWTVAAGFSLLACSSGTGSAGTPAGVPTSGGVATTPTGGVPFGGTAGTGAAVIGAGAGAPSGGMQSGGVAAFPTQASSGGSSGDGTASGGAPLGAGQGGSPSGNGPAGASGAGMGGSPATPPILEHTFDVIPIAPGQEILGTCQSWTLGNDTPLYVNQVVENNAGYFHHSNWIWVPDTLYTGPDGTWNCTDRGFDQIAAGAFGGVFFAQSTQSRADTQAFPSGVAFQMPAHARIIGDVHLFNSSDTATTSSLHFDVYTLPESDVRVPLQPMAFTNLTLDIAPSTETRARMQCATPQPDFNIYYILPHFHALGQGLSIDVAGGSRDGQTIFQSMGSIGESLGRMFDPPIAITGATALGITCDYVNPSATTVKYGEGLQEMCVALIYSDGKKAGGETIGNLSATDSAGVHSTNDLCLSIGVP